MFVCFAFLNETYVETRLQMFPSNKIDGTVEATAPRQLGAAAERSDGCVAQTDMRFENIAAVYWRLLSGFPEIEIKTHMSDTFREPKWRQPKPRSTGWRDHFTGQILIFFFFLKNANFRVKGKELKTCCCTPSPTPPLAPLHAMNQH